MLRSTLLAPRPLFPVECQASESGVSNLTELPFQSCPNTFLTPVRPPEVSGSWQSLLYPGRVALILLLGLLYTDDSPLREAVGTQVWSRLGVLLDPLTTRPPAQPLSTFLGAHLLFMFPHFSPAAETPFSLLRGP